MPAAVSVEPFGVFYPAEEYHQNYALKNPEAFAKELEESGRKKWPEEPPSDITVREV